MKAKPKDPNQSPEPTSPTMALLASLFVYPGVGQFMVGRKKAGILFILGFTALTAGLIFEIYRLSKPLLALYSAVEPVEFSINWPLLFFWLIGSSLAWIWSGLDAYGAAKKKLGEQPSPGQLASLE